jgi:metal-responsive CopG/Arc/MetJ family transcriptional regulator
MQRRTISLPDDVANALDREARRRRVPFSQLVREAIKDRLDKAEPKRRLGFIGIIKDAPPDMSERFDEYLAAARESDPRYDRYR